MILSRAAIALLLVVGVFGTVTVAAAAYSTGRTGVDSAPEGAGYHGAGSTGIEAPLIPSLQRAPHTAPDPSDLQTTGVAAPTDLTVHPLPNRHAKLSWSWAGTGEVTYDVEVRALTSGATGNWYNRPDSQGSTPTDRSILQRPLTGSRGAWVVH